MYGKFLVNLLILLRSNKVLRSGRPLKLLRLLFWYKVFLKKKFLGVVRNKLGNVLAGGGLLQQNLLVFGGLLLGFTFLSTDYAVEVALTVVVFFCRSLRLARQDLGWVQDPSLRAYERLAIHAYAEFNHAC